MPQELQRITGLFDQAKVDYLLFKCEHILQGKNKNLDLLLKTTDDYDRASHLLGQQGYILYMDEPVEKYKKMYILFDGKNLSAVHLHREVAWHGVVALDKENIFERARGKLPSSEDSLLIHSAHALFENFKVTDYHRTLLEKYKQETKDWNYIDWQLAQFGWKKSFYHFLPHFSLNPRIIVGAYGGRLRREPPRIFTLLKKVLDAVVRRISLKKKGYLLCLIGMNGAGKSTTKEALLQAYYPLTTFVAGQYGYYFGWKQSLLGKVFSIFPTPKEGKKLFDKVSEEKVKSFDLFQEFLFLFVYIKFLARYAKDIYPHLRRKELVITDRYFYDLYGQYPYSEKSRIMKLLPIPRPHQLILLEVSVETAMKRDKGGNAVRAVQPRKKLEGQHRRYQEIAAKYDALIINAENDFEKNISLIIKHSWREYIKSVAGKL
ncbi:MAG: hypothetical protein Q8R47_03920 [Nanoarchaeota archaeon]|nr:hypothetical protein [Nanoarchaeota archaeon]